MPPIGVARPCCRAGLAAGLALGGLGLALPALVAVIAAAPAAAGPAAPAGTTAPQIPSSAAPPPPVGAAALLGLEPLAIGADPAAAAAPVSPLTPAVLGGPAAPLPQPAQPAPAPASAPLATAPGAPTTAPAPPTTATAQPAPLATPSVATPPAANNNRALVLDRRKRLLTLLENGQPLRRFPVAVGMPGWETPVGSFKVLNKTENPIWEHPERGTHTPAGPTNPLGSRWIGFHQDCQGRRGWDGEQMLDVKGCVVAGFHGTPHRWTVGQALSHGCVRLYDEDVRQLFELVSVGTPVTVLP